MDVDPGDKYIEKNKGETQWYRMKSHDSISNQINNENGILVSFDGQSITFRLSIKKASFVSRNK